MTGFGRRLLPCLAAFLCGPASAELEVVPPAQIGLSEEGLAEVTRHLEGEVAAGRVAGAVGLIARRGGIGYFTAIGESDRESGTAMETGNLFRIASMTKAITSVAVMMLAEEGAVRLEDPAEKYLPEFVGASVFVDSEAVPADRAPTIHDLLTHTSGMGYGWFGPEMQDAAYREAGVSDLLVPVEETIGDHVARLGRIPLAFQPGERWAYSQSIDVLGRVVEVVTGLTLEQFFRERIFRPLGMADTHFYLPEEKTGRLAALYTPGEEGDPLRRVGSETLAAGPIRFSADYCLAGRGQLFAGGTGLVSSALDYARFLQVFLDSGSPLLKPATVTEMMRNQIGELGIGFSGHGDGFGYGFGVLTERGKAEDIASVGTVSWGGIFNTYFWVDPQEQMIGVLMTQVFPNDHLSIRSEFKRLAYDSIDDSGFSRLYWYEKGLENGNPFFNNRQLRVNAPGAGVSERFAGRSEVRSSGLARILIEEDLRSIRRADLACEIWGGHPGTSGKRLSVNGRRSYPIPDEGTSAGNCTHRYPTFRLAPSDLVDGHNSIQFACDEGTTFWGHYIVDNVCLRIGIDAEVAGVPGFHAAVSAAPTGRNGEAIRLSLESSSPGRIAAVSYQARYTGYDENGNGYGTDWHGMTRDREPFGHAGRSTEPPFAVDWDVSLISAQKDVAVKALVRFKDLPDVVHETAVLRGLTIPERESARVTLHGAEDVPAPFWSRAGRRLTCHIDLGEGETGPIEAAELHVVTWTGGAGSVANYFTLNGHGLAVAEGDDHRVEYVRVPVDPAILRNGENEIVLLSDTEHHGIEVLLPGPALAVRRRTD